jgi:hypothetical protein
MQASMHTAHIRFLVASCFVQPPVLDPATFHIRPGKSTPQCRQTGCLKKVLPTKTQLLLPEALFVLQTPYDSLLLVCTHKPAQFLLRCHALLQLLCRLGHGC